MPVAFFDLDHTLLNGDSDQLWGDYLLARGQVDASFQQRKNEFFAAYQRGKLDLHAFARFMLSTVKGQSWTTLQADLRVFASEKIAPVLREDGLTKIHWHQQRGDAVVIITATNRVIASAAASLLPGTLLIATEAEIIDDKISGDIYGTPSFREGKIVRAQHYCEQQQQQLSDSYFYSDSHNDLPLLQCVAHPHAVTPDHRLRAAAAQNGWPILMWQ